MPFDNATNRGRVEKMLDALGLIEASAVSNRASEADVGAMLAPLLQRLGAYRAPQPVEPDRIASTPPRPGSTRAWQSVREMAEQADLADLTTAMAVYLDRIGAAFDTMGSR